MLEIFLIVIALPGSTETLGSGCCLKLVLVTVSVEHSVSHSRGCRGEEHNK